MKFHVMTLFPEMIENIANTSILGRAKANNLIEVNAVNIRDFAFNKHKSVDDYPYGGGAGMLMQAEPVYQAYSHIVGLGTESMGSLGTGSACPDDHRDSVPRPRCIFLSPIGKPFTQEMAEEFAREEELILLCGHYEGIDERVLEEIVTDYVSIGDFVVTGGELPAMLLVDAISRLKKGVLHNDSSAEFESFQDNLLEYPHYSRPEVWHDKAVPEVLLSGHHANVEKWRREQSLIRTKKHRPDLLEKREKAELSEKDKSDIHNP